MFDSRYSTDREIHVATCVIRIIIIYRMDVKCLLYVSRDANYSLRVVVRRGAGKMGQKAVNVFQLRSSLAGSPAILHLKLAFSRSFIYIKKL
jgi:hypothetical protein